MVARFFLVVIDARRSSKSPFRAAERRNHFAGLAACAGTAAGGVSCLSAGAGFCSVAAGFGRSIVPRCRSISALHANGNTISPEAVSPIGIHPPGGTSSLFGGFLAVDSTDPVACAKAVPDIAVRQRTNRHLIGQFAEKFPTRLFERNNMTVTTKRAETSPAYCSHCGAHRADALANAGACQDLDRGFLHRW